VKLIRDREAWLVWFREAEAAFTEAMEMTSWHEAQTRKPNLEMRELAARHHGRYVERLTALNAYMDAQG
jgi:hypothetical protein